MGLPQKIWSKLSREKTHLLRDFNHRMGLFDSFYSNARGCRIMIYHGICIADHTRFNPIFLTVKTFEEHLQFYKKYFNVVSLDDYYQQKFSNDKFNVCLTFDDGFTNNHKYVLPLLTKYELPATFFITAIRAAGYDILWSDFLSIVSKYGPMDMAYQGKSYHKGKFNKYISKETGISLTEELRNTGFGEKAGAMKTLYPLAPFKKNKGEEDYWLQMTKEQIKELSASPFVTVGSHGYYHNDLARINFEDANKELLLAKEYLEDIIGKPVNSVAFPYGSYSAEIVEKAKQAGYSQLLAMDFKSAADQDDISLRERFTVNPHISTVNQMHATITRKYG